MAQILASQGSDSNGLPSAYRADALPNVLPRQAREGAAKPLIFPKRTNLTGPESNRFFSGESQ